MIAIISAMIRGWTEGISESFMFAVLELKQTWIESIF